MNRFLYYLLITLTVSSQIGNQKSLAVTIYNDNFAMVKDVRSISFDQGESFLYFTDVSSSIQTETVTFKALQKPESIRVYQQNFQQNLVNREEILKKYIQKDIAIYALLGQQTRKVKGKLLGFNPYFIIKTMYGVNIFNEIARIELPSLPQGFFTTPTLNWKVFSQQAITTDCEVAYRTTGFKWKADYSIILNQDQTIADIGGWVTIDNYSGKKYSNAKLKLIAGDVNIVVNDVNRRIIGIAGMDVRLKTSSDVLADAPQFLQQSFADYHLYTLSQPVTLNESSQKQVQFIPKVFGVRLRKYHIININAGGYTQEKLSAVNKIEFFNSRDQGLGIPLPQGIFRVFKEDSVDGSLEFAGQDIINHTPKNQNITLTTGNAFDIVADKYSQKRQSFDSGFYTADLNMTVVNHKNSAAEIQVRLQNYYEDNLKITWETNGLQLNKYSSNEYRWNFTLQPEQQFNFKWNERYPG